METYHSLGPATSTEADVVESGSAIERLSLGQGDVSLDVGARSTDSLGDDRVGEREGEREEGEDEGREEHRATIVFWVWVAVKVEKCRVGVKGRTGRLRLRECDSVYIWDCDES